MYHIQLHTRRIMSQVSSSHHLRDTVISNERPFACDLCAARFARASHLASLS